MRYVVIAGLILLLGFFGQFYTRSDSGTDLGHEPLSINLSLTTANDETVVRGEIPEGAKEYKDVQYSFSLLYPDNMSIKKFDDGGGASTVVFQDVDNGLGFQVFIVPYNGQQISRERFLKDVPSGVQKDLSSTAVGGVDAATFYSENSFLGETYEVWFVNGGFLYEVTTLKVLEAWLDSVVDTWIFI